ncbi:hypothetical protein M569_12881 [Genlisea aurea]|uniref:RING-type E3 ubiquitin transferase n=1 Tax=Genlisea aurea TaxID=192259 RepID=S8CC00_9LAMI|nr:hypothetical protein M569_12881 [Genlisea aurea]
MKTSETHSGSKKLLSVESPTSTFDFNYSLASSSNCSEDVGSSRRNPPRRNSGGKCFALQQSSNYQNLRGRNLNYLSRLSSDSEEELKRVRAELMQMTDLYNAACREAVSARVVLQGLLQWHSEEGVVKLKEAKEAQETAVAAAEKEKQKSQAAAELARKVQRVADLETEKRKYAEKRFELEKRKAAEAALANAVVQCRTYSIHEIEDATDNFSSSNKIGEGSYGPVYKAVIDYTPVAIKVLKSELAEGRKQFQREVEVLSKMRHPNLVILLGACPDHGCLVYEYMDNLCLEDRLFCKDGTLPLPWFTRFRIAAEIATALNFLHQTRPNAIVHRDLKPANVLLDRNFVSKISDVGLSTLVPAAASKLVGHQCLLTAAVGTFCYIDPEYQQTGTLGTESDIYSLGVVLLQLVTGRPPMGLTYHVESAIETGRFAEVLDPSAGEWPVDEALRFAELALKCCELRRRDRPDLDSVILPELERLCDLSSCVA